MDSGAEGRFINRRTVRQLGLKETPLPAPIKVYNVDGSLNQLGFIRNSVSVMMDVGGRPVKEDFLVTHIDKQDIILGIDWLRRLNPIIDWKKGTLDFTTRRASVVDIPDDEPQSINSLPADHPFIMEHRDTPKQNQEKATPNQEKATPKKPKVRAEKVAEYVLRMLETKSLMDPHIRIARIETDEFMTNPTQCETDDFIIAYTPGVTIAHTLRTTPETLGQDLVSMWINAKVNPAMAMAQRDAAENPTKAELPKEYQEFKDVFEKKAAERFPESRPYDHAIDLKPDFIPRDCKVYPLSPLEQEKMDEFLNENLRKGYIRPSKSPMASPFFFVGKKDGSLRPCQDYRYLNEGTVKNTYPLPLIAELVDQLKGSSIFTKLDLRSGYNNVRIKDGDQWKAAFKTNRGLFEPTVMFFGLCNSPATFQAMMNDIFRDMVNEGWLTIYMDDMLLHSDNLHEHRTRTKRVLQRLRENDLYLKLEKCVFEAPQVEFLGAIVSHNQVAMDPVKIKGILEWPVPTTVKQVRGFLGFGNFYRRFIDHYSDIAKPLNDLTKKDQPFVWTPECQQAFDLLKKKFTSQPLLQMPDISKAFLIESDASLFATAAVLRQQDANGDWLPVAYLSQSFNPAERNYEIYDRELLAIIRALDAWRHYLEGSPHTTRILTDHKNLTYFRSPKRLNRRQARWQLTLSQFNYKLEHHPGTRIVQADAMTRAAIPADAKDDNAEEILLPDDKFVATILLPDSCFEDSIEIDTVEITEIGIPVNDELTTKIQKQLLLDPLAQQVRLAMTTNSTDFPFRSDASEWKESNHLLFYNDRCYIPPNLPLRREIIQLYHDTPNAGHPGQWKTGELVRRDYFWPSMQSFISNYVKGCGACQQMKVNTHPTVPPLQPIIPTKRDRPFSSVTCDFITALPLSSGYSSLMVVVDHDSTKGVILCPCTEKIDAIGTARLYHEQVYRRFGLPDKFISDRGPQFDSLVLKELWRLTGVEGRMSTAYHPQTDGQTERVNREIEAYLRIFCSNHPQDWSRYIPDMEFAFNNREHSATRYSPFFLMLGSHPKAVPSTFPRTKVPSIQQWLLQRQRIREEANAAMDLATSRMASRFYRHFQPFSKGQKVWLEMTHFNDGYPFKKLAPKRQGPFTIKEVLGKLVYRLDLRGQRKIHDVFHASLLTPYHETEQHGNNYLEPVPQLIDGQEEYEVEAILNHRTKYGHPQYLVRWKNMPQAENSWEPESHLRNSQEILQEYKARHNLPLSSPAKSTFDSATSSSTNKQQWPLTASSPSPSSPTTLLTKSPSFPRPPPTSSPTSTTSSLGPSLPPPTRTQTSSTKKPTSRSSTTGVPVPPFPPNGSPPHSPAPGTRSTSRQPAGATTLLTTGRSALPRHPPSSNGSMAPFPGIVGTPLLQQTPLPGTQPRRPSPAPPTQTPWLDGTRTGAQSKQKWIDAPTPALPPSSNDSVVSSPSPTSSRHSRPQRANRRLPQRYLQALSQLSKDSYGRSTNSSRCSTSNSSETPRSTSTSRTW